MPVETFHAGRYSDTFRRRHYENRQCNALREFISRWQWQWYITLSFSPRFDRRFERAHNSVRSFLRSICIAEGLQIGSMYVISSMYGHYHTHLLALGHTSSNRPVQSLADVDKDLWRRYWSRRMRDGRIISQAAKIEEPRSINDVARYIAWHMNSSRSTWADFYIYNFRLLLRLQQVETPNELSLEIQGLIRQISPSLAGNLGLSE